MLGQTSLDGEGGDAFSFLQGMVQQLLSKEILYPTLKEVLDKYPAWLEEHKATLSPSDLQKYTKQLELLQKVTIVEFHHYKVNLIVHQGYLINMFVSQIRCAPNWKKKKKMMLRMLNSLVLKL